MSTLTLSALAPVPASGPGALDGFGFSCSCGTSQAASLPVIARQWRDAHAAWHVGRGDKVVAL